MEESLFIEIQRLCQLVHHHGLREISISQPEYDVTIIAEQQGGVMVVPAQVAQRPPVAAAAPPPVTQAPAAPQGYTISSPLIGSFYRAPSPDAPNFVEVGDRVEVGQTVGIVEAMKVFNEITAERGGTVVAIPVKNGQLVQVGQALVVLDTPVS